MQGELKKHGAVYDDMFAELFKKVDGVIPDQLSEMDREFKSWQRYIYKMEREMKTIDEREKNDTKKIMELNKGNYKKITLEMERLGRQGSKHLENERLLQNQIDDVSEQITSFNSMVQNNASTITKNTEDFRNEVAELTKRIDKAEHDRMSKYYKQVAKIEDWRVKIQDKIDDSYNIAEAVALHFGVESEIVVQN